LNANLGKGEQNSMRKRNGIVSVALRNQHSFRAVVDNHVSGAAITSKNPEKPVTNKG